MPLRLPFLIAALFLVFSAGALPAEAVEVNACDTSRKVAFEADQTGWNPYFDTSASRWNQYKAFRFAQSASNSYSCYAASQGYGGQCYSATADPKSPFIILASGFNPGEDVRPVNPPEPNTFDSSFPPTTEWYSCAAFCKHIEGATHCFDNNDAGMCFAAKLKSGSTVHTTSTGSSGTFCDNGQCESWGFPQAGTCTPLPQPADLTAGAITPVSAMAGVASSFSSTVANGGTSSAAASLTRFQWATSAAGDGATLITDTATAGIAAGGSQAVSASHIFAAAGTFYIRACADAGSAVAESNENNNCGAWTAITVAAGPAIPDLTAGAITPTTASLGQNREVSGTITNVGGMAAGASRSYFEVVAPNSKGNTTSIANTPALAAAAGSAAAFNYTFSYAGTYSVRVCADWYGEVTESNETNNCGPWTDIVVNEAPIPSSVSCTVSPSSAVVGGSVTYTANPVGAATSPYSWTGSDGATGFGSGSTAVRTFSAPGTYGMQVSATNAASAAQCPLVSVGAGWCTSGANDLTITATPARVRSGQSSTIAWSATGVNGQNATCSVTGPGVSWTSAVTSAPSCSASGTATTVIGTQSTYTLTCNGVSESVTVNVIPNFIEF